MKKVFALLVLGFAFNAFAQQSSYTICRAKVPCYGFNQYGQRIIIGERFCQSFGSAYTYGPSNMSNACTWEAVMGVGVRCTGYTNVNGYWRWNSFYANCPGY